MDDVPVNMSTRSNTNTVVNEEVSYPAMKRGMASPPTSKSATPKPIRRNEERFRRLSLKNMQIMRIFPAAIKEAKKSKTYSPEHVLGVEIHGSRTFSLYKREINKITC